MKTSPKKILSKLPLAIACTLAIAAATTGCQKHGSTHHKPHPHPQPQPQAHLDITVQHTSADNLQHTLQDKALGDPSENEIITVQDQTDTSLSTKITGDTNSMQDEILSVSKNNGLEINTTHHYKISGQDYTNNIDQQCTAQPVYSQHGSDANQLQATLKYTCKDTQTTNTSGIALTITHQASSANFRSTNNNSLTASNTKEELYIQDKELKFTEDRKASISDIETLNINHNKFKVGDTVNITPQTYTLSQAGTTYTCSAAAATSPALVAAGSAAVSMNINYTCKGGKTPPPPPPPKPTPKPHVPKGDLEYTIDHKTYGMYTVTFEPQKDSIKTITFDLAEPLDHILQKSPSNPQPPNYTMKATKIDLEGFTPSGGDIYQYTMTPAPVKQSSGYAADPKSNNMTFYIPLTLNNPAWWLNTPNSVNFNQKYPGLPQNIKYTTNDGTIKSASIDKDILNSFISTNGSSQVTAQLQTQPSPPIIDNGKYQIIGDYYGDWSVWPGHGFHPQNIPFANINMLNYGFASINGSNGDALMLDEGADIASDQAMPYLDIVQRTRPNLNTTLSFGGWGNIKYHNFTSGYFSNMFEKHSGNIKMAADNMVLAMYKSGFNGIDVDYEWNAVVATSGKGTNQDETMLATGDKPLCDPTNKTNCVPYTDDNIGKGYAELISDLRTDIDTLNKTLPRDDGKKYLLTTALIAGPDHLDDLTTRDKHTPVDMNKPTQDYLKTILGDMDFINLMSYDYHASFDATDENGGKSETSVTAESASNSDIKNSLAYIKKNYPTDYSKIVLGIPAYSHIEATAAPTAGSTESVASDGLGVPLAARAKQALGSYAGEFEGDYWDQAPTTGNSSGTERGSATYDYKCIINSASCIAGKTPSSLFSSDDLHPVTAGRNSTPFYYSSKNNAFLNYDDQNTAKNKIDTFVKSAGEELSGGFIWEADSDITPDDATNYESHSIICAIYKELTGNKSCTSS